MVLWSIKRMLPCPVGYGFEAVAIHLIREGQWREAVHLYREETGANLAQAEQAVERLALEQGIHRYSRGFLVSIIATTVELSLLWPASWNC